MTSRPAWEVVRDTIRDLQYRDRSMSTERIAEVLQVHPATVYAYTEPPKEENGSGRSIPLTRGVQLMETAKDDRLARWIIGQLQASGLLEDIQFGEPGPGELAGAKVEGVDYSGKDLRNLHAPKATFHHCNFNGAALDGADLTGATLIDCRAHRTRLVAAKMAKVTVVKSDLTEARLDGADAREIRTYDSVFRNCSHTGVDFRRAAFSSTRWFADRFRGGGALDGTDIDGLIGISESHMMIGEVVRRIAAGRKKHELLAGWTWGHFDGCWLASLYILDAFFTNAERDEILGGLAANPNWLIAERIDLESQKRAMLSSEFGGDFPDWPPTWKEQVSAIAGKPVTVAGVDGHISNLGLFVPAGVDVGDERPGDELLSLIRTYRA